MDQILVDGSPKQNPYTFSAVTTDHTISATFKQQNLPAVVPLCPAGTPFDADVYPQNTPQLLTRLHSSATWMATGVSISPVVFSVLNGVRADDGFTITIQPSRCMFDAQPHYACAHHTLELTSGMRPGLNTFTLVVKKTGWGSLLVTVRRQAPE